MKAAALARIALVLALLLVTAQNASAASATGPGALALAALVAPYSTSLSMDEKQLLMRLLSGDSAVSYPAGAKIVVKAESVVCRASNVDLTSRSCKLNFGVAVVDLTGRLAHELYATIGEVGVPADGAAGSVFESLSHLECTIDPNVIAQKAGGGADCSFDLGGT